MKTENLSDESLNVFKITFDAEEVEAEEAKTLEKLRSSVEMKGFPKGEVPVEMLRKLFAGQLLSTTGDVLLARVLGALSAEHPNNIKPEIHPEYRAQAGKKYTGKKNADGEIEIVVQWKNPEQVPITNLVCEVEVEKADRDAIIANQLEILKIQAGALKSVERGAIETDYVVTRVDVMRKDGTLFGSFPNQSINHRLKESMFGEKVADAVMGKVKGDKVIVPKYFSPNFHYKPLQDLEADLHVEITDVFENIVPELNDDFAKKVGAESMDDLRAKITAKWEAVEKDRQDKAVRAQLLDKLLAQNPIERDESLYKKNLKNAKEDVLDQIGFEGTYEELMEKLPEEKDRAKFNERCEKSADQNTRWAQLMQAVIAKYPKETILNQSDLLRYAANPKSGNSPEAELKALQGQNYYQGWLRNKRITKAYEYVRSLAVIKEVEAKQVQEIEEKEQELV